MSLLADIPVHHGRLFTWHRRLLVGTSEMSTLTAGGKIGSRRIWDDAYDVGFYVESPATGRKVLFTLTKEHRNNDNDITHWTYVSHNHPLTMVITVYNT